MRRKKRIIAIIQIMALMLSTGFMSLNSMKAEAASQTDCNSVFRQVREYAYSTTDSPQIGAIGGDWLVYGLKLSGFSLPDSYLNSYRKSVEDAVLKGYRGTPGILHDKKYTEYSRVVFVYSVLGWDPANVAGYNLIEKLYNFDQVVWQGVNGPIWALRALDEGKYEIPELSQEEKETLGFDNITSRDKLIDYILSCQTKDGGWNIAADLSNLDTCEADPDMTGMAMTALAPYRVQRTDVKDALDRAVKVLSEIQDADGGYSTMGSATSESCAQVIFGLSACGINPAEDPRFRKNGKSVVDALLGYFDSKVGGFRHVNQAVPGYDPVVNQMATEQALYSLAYFKAAFPDSSEDGDAYIKELASGLSLKLNGAKTDAGKVAFSFGPKAQEKLKNFEDSGYKLDFYYYKTTNKKKASSDDKSDFTYMSHKIKHYNAVLVPTKGVKGTVYYYKTIVKIKDEGGRIVAEIGLDQVDYGFARWTGATIK